MNNLQSLMSYYLAVKHNIESRVVFTYFVLWVLMICLFSPQLGISQITEKPVYGKIAIQNVDIYPVTSEPVIGGVVLIEGDAISFVGQNVKADLSEYHVIDGTGKRLYPGFIDSWTILGLVEVNAVPVTVDHTEQGQFNPEMLAFTAINPNAAAIPVTRVEGITSVIAAPRGGTFSGKSTLIDLYGYTPDSMAVSKEAGMILNFPSVMRGWGWQERDDDEIEKAYREAIAEIDDFIKKAVFYDQMMVSFEASATGKKQPDRDPKMEAMRSVIRGDVPIVISVNRDKDILNAIEWTKTYPEFRFVFAGVSEGWRVADSIAEAGIPVIVNTLYTPVREYDNYQRPYQNPGLMAQSGVQVIISSFGSENTRNLIFNAGYAATYGATFGFGSEEAIKAITIEPARVWGVEDRLGSIEVGKQANLILIEGDPLETIHPVSQVFIRGRMIPMQSRHIQLFDEFLDRDAVLP